MTPLIFNCKKRQCSDRHNRQKHWLELTSFFYMQVFKTFSLFWSFRNLLVFFVVFLFCFIFYVHYWHYGEKHCGVCPYQCTAYWIQLSLNPNGEEDTPRSQVSTCDGPPAVPRTAAKTVAFLSVSGLLCDVPGSYWVTYCTFSSSFICSNDSYLLVLLVQLEPCQDVGSQVEGITQELKMNISFNPIQSYCLDSDPVA